MKRHFDEEMSRLKSDLLKMATLAEKAIYKSVDALNKRDADLAEELIIEDKKIDAFFVTLQKTQEAYSPTTMYEDYAISDELFHWQSQSTTSATSATGQRYINQRENGYTPLLFVRESKALPSGLTLSADGGITTEVGRAADFEISVDLQHRKN